MIKIEHLFMKQKNNNLFQSQKSVSSQVFKKDVVLLLQQIKEITILH